MSTILLICPAEREPPMADKLSPQRRSDNMRRIRSRDTGPEKTVRMLLRALGHTGYRLHRKDIPGKPDIAFVGCRKVIFVHGCFWHGHSCKEGLRQPKSNIEYWQQKIAGNQVRDAKIAERLHDNRWAALTLWECELKKLAPLTARLTRFLE
jgi:DNA mismatch endonuclease, patch repair protein